uniref:Retrovirus-related Pol polyprotein from transposon TNT 1-94 n=1 Tax=Lactuca sativa TaxID=4236 RepID=A0A9R1UQ83_LACSA|nr:hypothetical protein LSAT_V11C800438430 [Lactuca sativa]
MCDGKTTYELLKGGKPGISYFHVFGCVCYILNQRDQRSRFEAKDDEWVFLVYCSMSKLPGKLLISHSMKTHSFIHDRIDHPSSIVNELTFRPLDVVPNFLLNDTKPIVPNIDQIFNSQPNSKDQPIVSEETEPYNQEDYVPNNTNECSNPRILHDNIESQIIGDINSGILTRSRVNSNVCMFVNFVSMIKPNNVVDAMK